MSSWDCYETSDAPLPPDTSEVDVGQTLRGKSSSYHIVDFIGEGCFGKVAKCHVVESKETVAVKILKDAKIMNTEREVSILELISVLDPVRTNVVQFFECFEFMGQTCLAFEMLDMDLYTLMEERDWAPLFLSEIRPIAQQLFVALDALKGIGLLHCDIKPDNVMMTNLEDHPLRVKLIDFGQAMKASEVQPGMMVQPSGYRAPEVALGLPFSETIDIWGVGCILAYLYLADNLFPVDCEYQVMKCVVDILGYPEDRLLQAGKYSQYFFTEVQSGEHSAWRLMTPEEYAVQNNITAKERKSFFNLPSSLDGLVNIRPETQAAEVEDRKAFIDLLKGLLHLDGEQRISPHQALHHPFVSMSHLTDPKSRGYLMVSEDLMSICPVEGSSESCPPVNSAELAYISNNEPATVQFDGVKAPLSLGGDSGVWSLYGANLTESADSVSSPVCLSNGELAPDSNTEDGLSCNSEGELPSLLFADDASIQLCDGALPEHTKEAPASSDSTFRRISKFFRGVMEVFCCCVRQQED